MLWFFMHTINTPITKSDSIQLGLISNNYPKRQQELQPWGITFGQFESINTISRWEYESHQFSSWLHVKYNPDLFNNE